jgi:glycosyltransferase involved in cell wall biosynthesis
VRVLHVINSLGGSGGAEHGLVREITRFSDTTEQMVVRLFSKDQLDARIRDAGIDIVGLGFESGHAGWNWPAAAYRLATVIKQFGPDVVHSSLFAANLVAQLSGRWTKMPVLSTFTQSGDPLLLRNYQPGASSRRASALRSIAARAARGDEIFFRALTRDALVTNCALLGVDPARATVIPRGVETDIRPSALMSRLDLGLPADGRLLVNIGRQTSQKGHISLLKAFEIVHAETESHLVILGREGDATREIEGAIDERELTAHVSLIGYTSDVHHYLAHADVFVFTSFMEGLGTAVLEAMAMGLPIVAYDIPPVQEVTDDGRLARLVAVGDHERLADQIMQAFSDKSPADEERSWVARKFSIDEVASQVETLLSEVAGR